MEFHARHAPPEFRNNQNQAAPSPPPLIFHTSSPSWATLIRCGGLFGGAKVTRARGKATKDGLVGWVLCGGPGGHLKHFWLRVLVYAARGSAARFAALSEAKAWAHGRN